jgi:hypothetical protein
MGAAPSDLLVLKRDDRIFIQPICECGFTGQIFRRDDLAAAVAQLNLHDLQAHADTSSLHRPTQPPKLPGGTR